MSKKVKTVKRKFSVKPAVMLTAAKTVGKNLETNMDKFGDYPHLTQEWLNGLYGDIDVMNKKIGVKANEQQHIATIAINAMEAGATKTALTIKNQMERGFKKNKARLGELIDLLGYKTNWTKANKGNQNALLELLHTFNNHADSSLYGELTAHQVAAVHIDKMKEFAQMMNEANVTQESLKSASPTLTAETNTALNDIYDKVMDICSAGKIIFRDDPVKKALFNFTKLTAQQVAPAKTKTQPADTDK